MNPLPLTQAVELAGAGAPEPVADSSYDLRTALPSALVDGLPNDIVERMVMRRALGLALARATGEWRGLLRGDAS